MNNQVTFKNAWNKLISLIKNNQGYWEIALILFMILLILLSIICYILPTPWRRYWYEDNGHFPWVGISVFIAAIGFIGNQIWERKKFNADIKSKSRIEWMVTVRELLANYITDSESLYNIMSKAETITDNVTFESVNQKQSSEYRELLLYIPIADDNKKILNKINEVEKIINDKKNSISIHVNEQQVGNLQDSKNEDDLKKHSLHEKEKLDAATKEAIETGRKYFKHEWERAKRGE